MQWSFIRTVTQNIVTIEAHVQNQSNIETQIVYWAAGALHVFTYGEEIYKGRLTTYFIKTDNSVTLKIMNAKYEDSGNYSVKVALHAPNVNAEHSVTLNVNGMFFSYC